MLYYIDQGRALPNWLEILIKTFFVISLQNLSYSMDIFCHFASKSILLDGTVLKAVHSTFLLHKIILISLSLEPDHSDSKASAKQNSPRSACYRRSVQGLFVCLNQKIIDDCWDGLVKIWFLKTSTELFTCLGQLLSSNLCKQLGSRLGPSKCG